MSITIDPEVREIVDEVLSDPESTLTRMPDEGFGGWLTQGPASGTTSWLTKAERHLVRVHRESVAALFYQACQTAALSSCNLPLFSRSPTAGIAIGTVELGSWRDRVQHELVLEATLEGRSALESLHSGLQLPGSRLAAFSLNLVPRDETRLWLGICLISSSQHALAACCFERVAAGTPTALNKALAFANLGVIHLGSGNIGRAWQAYEDSVQAEETLPGLVGLMNTSLMIGRHRRFLEASGILGRLLPERHIAVEDYRSIVGKTAGMFHSQASSSFLDSIAERIPSVAVRVFDLLRRSPRS